MMSVPVADLSGNSVIRRDLELALALDVPLTPQPHQGCGEWFVIHHGHLECYTRRGSAAARRAASPSRHHNPTPPPQGYSTADG